MEVGHWGLGMMEDCSEPVAEETKLGVEDCSLLVPEEAQYLGVKWRAMEDLLEQEQGHLRNHVKRTCHFRTYSATVLPSSYNFASVSRKFVLILEVPRDFIAETQLLLI